MRLVLDNNIFFSLMNPNSINSYLFSLGKIKFIAPEFLIEELEEHKEECIVKSGLSEQEFEIRKEEVKQNIEFIEFSEYIEFLKEAIALISDPDDALYFALALKLGCGIWSNDKKLKEQDKIKVYSTEEIIELLV